jgi:hypothetical protein
VKYVCTLPCLEHLYLMGNSVTSVLDYRTKVLAMFGDRVIEVNILFTIKLVAVVVMIVW